MISFFPFMHRSSFMDRIESGRHMYNYYNDINFFMIIISSSSIVIIVCFCFNGRTVGLCSSKGRYSLRLRE